MTIDSQVPHNIYEFLVIGPKHFGYHQHQYEYFTMFCGQEEIMMMERILLQTIKFDLQVDHPYQYLIKFGKGLKGKLLLD